MLNGASLNKAAINAAAGVSLVLATASFTAGSDFVGEGTHEKAAFANITCSVQSIFGGIRTQYAFWNPVGTASIDSTVSRSLAATGDWTASAVGQFFSLSTIPAAAGFDATATFEALANAKLGNVDWTGDATFAAVPTKTSSLDGDWDDLNSGWLLGEGLRSAGAFGDWDGTAALWCEPTVDAGGVLDIEGYVFWGNTTTLENERSLTATFINGAWALGTGDWAAPAFAVYGASASWSHDSDLAMEGRRTFYKTADLEAGATFTAAAGVINQADQINLTHASHFSGRALMLLAGDAALVGTSAFTSDGQTDDAGTSDWSMGATLEVSAVRMAGTKMVLDTTSDFTISGKIAQGGFGSWSGLASSLSGGAVLKLVPAPHTRVYVIPQSKRAFTVPPRSRVYEVAA